MYLSSIEIGRRGYKYYHQYVLKDKYKEKNIIFDKLENVKERVKKSLKNWTIQKHGQVYLNYILNSKK